MISYALFAQSLPSGHLFQQKIENVQCGLGCSASTSDIQDAVDQFVNPDVTSSKAANAAALGRKLKQKTPPPASVTVTVLNGNGVPGAAANASYLLAQRGYVTLTPPNGLAANGPRELPLGDLLRPGPEGLEARGDGAPEPDAAGRRREAAATARPALARPGLDAARRARQTFHGSIAADPAGGVPKHQPAYVRYDAAPATDLLKPLAHKLKFPLMVPTVLERNSYPDTLPGDKPVRQYWIDRAVATRRSGSSSTTATSTGASRRPTGTARRCSPTRASATTSAAASSTSTTPGSHLHMVVLRAHGATYWVVNTLLDDLSNETMLAIAKGLKPLTPGK